MLMEELNGTRSYENGEDYEENRVDDDKILRFLDSMESYLTLMDSLSSSVRQGWLELASARHSMGDSRINGALFSLKIHPAATTVQINQHDDGNKQPQFSLRKWASLEHEKGSSAEAQSNENELLKDTNGSQLRHRGSQSSDPAERAKNDGSPPTVDNQIQKERLKSLSMFGTLVSPKLRSSQISFETALETLIEVANMRSSILSTFNQIQKELEVSALVKTRCRKPIPVLAKPNDTQKLLRDARKGDAVSN